MDARLRIGVAGVTEPRLEAELRALPIQPLVLSFSGIYEDTGRIVAERPDLLFVAPEPQDRLATDLIGAIRVLRGLLPEVGVVAVVPAEHEVRWHDLQHRAGAGLLLSPFRTPDLARAVDRALAGHPRARDEAFLDLARGFADEVNNPLMFLTGHLQLLAQQLDPAQQRNLRDQIDSALAGAARIQGTVDRLQLLSRAAAGSRASDPFHLATAVDTARLRLTPELTPLRCEPAALMASVPGDAVLLQEAIDELLRVTGDLARAGTTAHLELQRLERSLLLRLSLTGPGLEDWRLPRTFEPFYLNRLLRGTSHGLGLFLVQTVVHGHGGLATARRLPGGTVAIDLQLPSA